MTALPNSGFLDRDDAGRALAAAVTARAGLAGPDVLVLGLARGGVPIARQLADALGAEWDVLVVRKIGAPEQPELGVGAVAPSGLPLFDRAALEHLGLSPIILAPTVERERTEARRRLHLYRGDRPPPRIAGRPVIVTDDGLATGGTAVAALRSVRVEQPSRLVFAAPVCSHRAATLTREADQVICAQTPADFRSVSTWYQKFPQISDAEVIRALEG